jgi:hypothetical protein
MLGREEAGVRDMVLCVEFASARSVLSVLSASHCLFCYLLLEFTVVRNSYAGEQAKEEGRGKRGMEVERTRIHGMRRWREAVREGLMHARR